MHATVEHVIQDAIETTPIGEHGLAEVHEFPEEIDGLSDVLIRRTPRFPISALSHSSSFYPAAKFVSGVHAGQPLMSIQGQEGFDILLREPGQTLAAWEEASWQRITTKNPHTDLHTRQSIPEVYQRNLIRQYIAFCDLIEAYEKAHGNPFYKPFDETYQLGRLGLKSDASIGNIMVDEAAQQFSLIDQYTVPRGTSSSLPAPSPELQGNCNLDEFSRFFSHHYRPDELIDCELSPQLAERRAYVLSRIVAGRNAVLQDHADGGKTRIRFRDVSNVKAVKLSDPPEALIEQVHQLKQLADLPSR